MDGPRYAGTLSSRLHCWIQARSKTLERLRDWKGEFVAETSRLNCILGKIGDEGFVAGRVRLCSGLWFSWCRVPGCLDGINNYCK